MASSTVASDSAGPESTSISSSAAPSDSISTVKSTTTATTKPTWSTTTENHEDNQTFPPMTTHWTVPQSCTWTYNVDTNLSSSNSGAVAWLDLEPTPGASTLSCYPDGMFFQGRTGIFSPGTCPNGWTTVSLRVNTNEVRDEATTTAICCSSEYYLDGDQCKRTVPTVLAVPITYNHTARTYEILSDSTTTLYSATIAVYTIRALFQEADKAALGLKDEDDIGTEEDPKGLSLGARIGIGVGVAMFVLLAIAAGAFFIIRRDRDRARKKRSLELNAISRGEGNDGGNDLYVVGEMHERRDRCGDHPEPYPPYEAATDTVSMTDNESRLSGDTATRDGEIKALRDQKQAIQRRIEQLEHSESSQNQDQNPEQNRA
ncbi:hypothetical protein G7Z17_g13514 [Cylindrodendrum hubeiense]|uniref:Uncharacterized protein n=1 Tax=Cylindrodendrum hubeiense TaxID=595255 RepID=A0A9P5GZT7_9HYPO|nr:hypothetical protein G7Z17_g13514 [Cylindrodendrum hubeiense]